MENIHLIFNKVYIIYSKSLLFLLFVVHSFLLSSQIQSVFFFFVTACPLGAYCPLATLNDTTGLCDP